MHTSELVACGRSSLEVEIATEKPKITRYWPNSGRTDPSRR